MTRRATCVLAALAVAACNTILGIDPAVSADAGNTAEGGREAEPPDSGVMDADPCSAAVPFGARALVGGINDGVNTQPSAALSPDERTIWFVSTRYEGGAPFQIYTSTRTSSTDPFPEPMLAPGVSPGPDNELAVGVSTDTLALVFAQATAQNGIDLFLASRADTSMDFVVLGAMKNVNTAQDDTTPYLTATGSAIYLSRGFGASDYSIWRAARSGSGYAIPDLLKAVDVNKLSTQSVNPVIVDERTLYFGSNRDGTGDIFVAQRPTDSDPFGAAKSVAELNTKGFEAPTWLSPDGCTLYFVSSGLEDGGIAVNNSRSLYKASRKK